MFSTADFEFDLTKYPYQFIHRHCTTTEEEWDKYHSHHGMEIIFVHEGNGSVIIDHKIFPFGPGTLMYFQPFQLHRVRAELTAGYYIRSKILFDPLPIANFLPGFPSLLHFFHHLWEGQLPCQVLDLEAHKNEFESIFSLYPKADDSADNPEQFAIFTAMLLQLIKRHWQQQVLLPVSKLRHIHNAEEIMRWIDRHFHEDFDLSQLAGQLHLSVYHISHLFKKATGGTITDYLISRRLREACLLLKTTPLSVQEISRQVGIGNVSYFCRIFKSKYGLSPAKYRSETIR